jgi:hypothetical protein
MSQFDPDNLPKTPATPSANEQQVRTRPQPAVQGGGARQDSIPAGGLFPAVAPMGEVGIGSLGDTRRPFKLG